MDKASIIEHIANERMVESMVENIAHQALNDDLSDLCQMIYVLLLEYDEEKLQDLWEHNQIRSFLARIIVNQYRSSTSSFHYTFRKFRTMIDEVVVKSLGGACDIAKFDMLYSQRVLTDED